MDADIRARHAESPAASADGRRDPSGAAIGALAFPVIGPVGVVAIRQWVAGTILMRWAGRGCGRSLGDSGGP